MPFAQWQTFIMQTSDVTADPSCLVYPKSHSETRLVPAELQVTVPAECATVSQFVHSVLVKSVHATLSYFPTGHVMQPVQMSAFPLAGGARTAKYPLAQKKLLSVAKRLSDAVEQLIAAR